MGLLALRRHASGATPDNSPYNLTLSVLVLTYQHERFLARALEGALAQKTSFLFEIVISDDASSDSTRHIATAFQAAHPHRFRVLVNSSTVGPSRNFSAGAQACRGKYIAILEGDDYWIDRHKLQRQVELLESDRGLSCCFHNVDLLENDKLSRFHNAPSPQRAFSLPELIRSNLICNCSTVVFRSACLSALPTWFADSRYYDWPLHVYNARQGAIGYIPDVMSVYRIHDRGAWHGADRVERIESVIWLLERMRADFGHEYQRDFHLALREWRSALHEERAVPRESVGSKPHHSPAPTLLQRLRGRLVRKAA